jgi:hypothetical protein
VRTVQEEFDELVSDKFDRKIDELLAADEAQFAAGGASGQTGGAVKEYQTVGPEARARLRGILAHYAKSPKPFTQCVVDNTKRFGPERAQKVCAVIKDMIRGTTKWRGHPSVDRGSAGLAASECEVMLDEETMALVDRLDEMDLWDLLGLAELDGSGVLQAHRDELYMLHPHVAPRNGSGPSVSLKRDTKGWYVHTHSARSKSYATIANIPRHAVNYIKSTG